MITRITLKNVRLFSDTEWTIPLPPLAIFCGANSAGKSTILKTLLLLRQSQGIQESQGAQRGRLRFAGSQVDVGDYTSFVSHNDASREIGIGISIEAEAPARWVAFLQTLSVREQPSGVQQETQSDVLVKHVVSADFCFGGTPPRVTTPASRERCRLAGELKHAKFQIKSSDTNLLQWRVKQSPKDSKEDKEECSYDACIPEAYFKKVGGMRMMRVDASNDQGDFELTTVLSGLLPDGIVAKIRRGKKDTEQELWSTWPMPPHINDALREFREALAELHYLGPLRSPAKRFYLSHLDARPSVDPTGESLPAILRERSNDLVWTCGFLPGDQPQQVSLGSALNSWIRYFRTGSYDQTTGPSPEIELTITSDVLVEIKIKSVVGVESHALTDSGFGFSQVLPIVVRGLLSEPNSTLLVEQPELHLNPAIQVRLANFFAAMVLARKQVILETHSEHIVNAIRVLCAEDTARRLHSKCNIFYVSAHQGVPNIHELSIRPDGMVPDWPRDFFGEAADLTGRLLRAQKQQLKK